jgi:hypothetical protein
MTQRFNEPILSLVSHSRIDDHKGMDQPRHVQQQAQKEI